MLSPKRARRTPQSLFPRVEALEERTLLSGLAVADSPATPNEGASSLSGAAIVGSPAPLPGPQEGAGTPSGFARAASSASPGAGDPQGTTLEVRKNQADLTDKEKQNFVNAILKLKNTYNPGSTLSVYDQFVQEHYDAFSSGQAHEGPAFLAWHREFLLEFEQELQTVDPTVTIPYWDFTVDNSADSSIWSDDFMGGNGDPNDNHIVKTGPFQQGQWTLALDGPDLRRDFGGLVSTLPTADDVQAAFAVTTYDVFPFDSGSPIDQSFRNNLEGFNHPSGEAELHNRVHDWIGGSMAIAYSPNDPVFWLLHADIDRIWAEWEDQNGLLYAPDGGGHDGQNLTDPMSPFNVTPQSVLDVRALGYRYDTQSDTAPSNGGGGGSGGAGAPLALLGSGGGHSPSQHGALSPGSPPPLAGWPGDHAAHSIAGPAGVALGSHVHAEPGSNGASGFTFTDSGDHAAHSYAGLTADDFGIHLHLDSGFSGVFSLSHASMGGSGQTMTFAGMASTDHSAIYVSKGGGVHLPAN